MSIRKPMISMKSVMSSSMMKSIAALIVAGQELAALRITTIVIATTHTRTTCLIGNEKCPPFVE